MAAKGIRISIKTPRAEVDYEGPVETLMTDLSGFVGALLGTPPGAAAAPGGAPAEAPAAPAPKRRPGRPPKPKAAKAAKAPKAAAPKRRPGRPRKATTAATPAPAAEASSEAGPDGGTLELAQQLGATTGPGLIMAAAANLAIRQGRGSFSRRELSREMQSATGFYRSTYSNNLSKYLDRLIKSGKLSREGRGQFSMPLGTRTDIEARLG